MDFSLIQQFCTKYWSFLVTLLHYIICSNSMWMNVLQNWSRPSDLEITWEWWLHEWCSSSVCDAIYAQLAESGYIIQILHFKCWATSCLPTHQGDAISQWQPVWTENKKLQATMENKWKLTIIKSFKCLEWSINIYQNNQRAENLVNWEISLVS